MRRTLLWILCLVIVTAMVPAFTQAAEKPAKEAVQLQAISYPPDAKIDVAFQPRSELSKATGKATVTTKEGTTQIAATFKKLDAPSMQGPEFLVYVLWAITPEGRVTNLGPIRLDGDKGDVLATTRFQSFALGVTAEPYFAVSIPSSAVILTSMVPDKKHIQAAPIEVKAELLQRGYYKEAGLQPVVVAPKTPLELYQARNAVQIARSQKADQYAADSFTKAVRALEKAEAAQVDKKAKKETVIMASRDAVQAAEDARGIAVKRVEEERLAAERQAAMEREAAARAQAESEAQQRQIAEQQRDQSEAARGQSEAARAQSETARAQSETARAQAMAGQRQAINQAAGARAAAQKQRADLFAQLNKILETVDTERGLVATMAGVTFSTNSSTLKPAARESVAKLAGVLALNPGLKLDIEGYTDSLGSDTYNQSLSEKRAAAVRDYLVEQGIPAGSIDVKGLGKGSPVASNDDPKGREKNRRVEIVVSGEAIGTQVGG